MRHCLICDKEFTEKDNLRRLLQIQHHLIKEHGITKSIDELLMIWKKLELEKGPNYRLEKIQI